MAAESDRELAELVRVVLPTGKELSLPELGANENIVNHTEIRIRLADPDEEEGEGAKAKKKRKKEKGARPLRVEHHLWGEALPSDAVRVKGDVHVLQLFRGRNEVFVQREGDEEPFSFPLYYRSVALEWIESLLKALVLVVVVKTFVVQAFFIPTGSMEDTLFPSDYILVEKVTGLFERPKSGDVIVFQFPLDPTKDFIKRKVGDEGDSLAMRAKTLYKDGECVQESYVAHKDKNILFHKRDFWGPLEIPAGHSYALGDNRDNSKDSRFWGPLPDYRLKGRALAIYWPLRHWGFVRPEVPEPQEGCTPLAEVPAIEAVPSWMELSR